MRRNDLKKKTPILSSNVLLYYDRTIGSIPNFVVLFVDVYFCVMLNLPRRIATTGDDCIFPQECSLMVIL